MSQHDYVIDNDTGANVRSDLNNAFAAIVTQNSGATAPSTTYAYMFWADTTAGVLKQRNAANSAWVSMWTLGTGLVIGTDVQAYDADTLKADTADVLTAGFGHASHDLGTITTGTTTLDEANGNMQKCVANGAFTLAPQAEDSVIIIHVENDASAGAITTSGYDKVDGTYDTTDNNEFLFVSVVSKDETNQYLKIIPLQ